MKTRTTLLGILALAATAGLAMPQDRPAEGPDAAPAEAGKVEGASEREPDVRAITDLLTSFVKAYNARDAEALGHLFTQEAEIEDEDGGITRGRDAVVKRFAETWQADDAGTLRVDRESLRFLGSELAVEEGTASLSVGTGTPPRTNRYSALYTRQGGRWLHARVRDEPEDDPSAHERLRELEWLLGEWVNESDDEVVFTTCKWSDSGNYLLREFDVKIEGGIALRGTQRIGWDPQRGQFRTWVFDDQGGFAEGLLSHEDDRWLVRGSGVRSDGTSVSFSTAITPLDKDRLRWEILERTIGGETASNIDRFELVRRPPTPGK